MLRPLRSYYFLLALSVITVISLSAFAEDDDVGTLINDDTFKPASPPPSRPQLPPKRKPQPNISDVAKLRAQSPGVVSNVSQWTHTVNTPNGILYYNAQTGAGAIGRIDSAGNQITIKSYPAGFFSTGWTHIVNTPNGILWYDSKTGAGAVGRIDSAGNHSTIKSYPAGFFSTGWTEITSTSSGIHYYNAQTGARVVGQIDSEGNHITLGP